MLSYECPATGNQLEKVVIGYHMFHVLIMTIKKTTFEVGGGGGG